jgi:hypothetical protein
MLYNYYSCHKDVAMLLILLRFYVNDIAYFFFVTVMYTF